MELGFDGSARASAGDDTRSSPHQKSVNQIAAEMEALVGNGIAPINEDNSIQDSGLEGNPGFTDMDDQEYDMANQLTTING